MPFAQLKDVCLSYEIEGNGSPLLLIAGTGHPGSTWRTGPSARLAAAGFQVVTYDHRGTGKSDTPDEPYSTRLFAEDAVGLLTTLNIDRAHILGHSMGGRVAQWVALDHPDRVRSLVLAASGSGASDPSKPMERGIPVHTAEEMIRLGYERYAYDHIASFFFTPQFVRDEPQIVRALGDAFWAKAQPLMMYLRHVTARQQHQTAERLKDISAPTLVIVGNADVQGYGSGNHVAQSEYLAAHIAGAELYFVDGAAHGLFWMRPAETTDVIADFLRRF